MQLVDPKIEDYCRLKSNLPGLAVQEIETYTRANVPGANMLIGPMEASVLGFLIRLVNAKRVLELGTYTGYSALSMAENLPEDGELITVDVDKETAQIAQNFWNKSAHGKKIKSIIGPGLEVIPTLKGTFDCVFIDADKRNYLNYLKLVLPLLSENGVIVIDNVLWSGKVLPDQKLNPQSHNDMNTDFIREVNNYIFEAQDLYGTLLPIRDGMFLVQKKKF